MSQKIAAFMAAVVTLTAFLGIFVCVGMDLRAPIHHHASHTMNTQPCDANSAMAHCQMGVLEHIATWENTFLGFLSMDMIILLTSAVICTVGLILFLSFPKETILQKTKEYLFYIRSHPERLLYHNLISAYSHGIIQPKILA